MEDVCLFVLVSATEVCADELVQQHRLQELEVDVTGQDVRVVEAFAGHLVEQQADLPRVRLERLHQQAVRDEDEEQLEVKFAKLERRSVQQWHRRLERVECQLDRLLDVVRQEPRLGAKLGRQEPEQVCDGLSRDEDLIDDWRVSRDRGWCGLR